MVKTVINYWDYAHLLKFPYYTRCVILKEEISRIEMKSRGKGEIFNEEERRTFLVEGKSHL